MGFTEGFGGRIIKFKHDSFANSCVKIPKLSNNVDPVEAARRFLHEIKFQKQLYFHPFVHWPSDFDFILDTPVAWFRFWSFDLADMVDDVRFDPVCRLAMLSYIATGLLHCHGRGLDAHQDLKPENIFVQDLKVSYSNLPGDEVYYIPKIADFGSANLWRQGEFRGTRPYMAPEQWSKQPLGQHTTVWTLGLLTYELLSYGIHPIGERTRPWRNKEKSIYNRWQKDKMWKRWLAGGGQPNEMLYNTKADVLVRRCMQIDPALRPTIQEYICEVITILRDSSSAAAAQVTYQISSANAESSKDHNWPYQDFKINWLVKQIKRKFPAIILP